MPKKSNTINFLEGAKKSKHDDAAIKLYGQHENEWYLCGTDFWYFLSKVRTEDEDSGTIRPFPVNYEYLQSLDQDIEEHQKVVLLKSRRLMASWLGMLRMLHGGMFANSRIPSTPDSFRGGVMSVGETEAMYLIERISKVYHRLPYWMQQRSRLNTDNKLLLRWEGGGTVQAFPMKREGPQGFGFTRVFFDEMALQEAARSTWTGMIPTLGARGKLLAVSTPNGKQNFFYEVWANRDNRYGDVLRREVHWRSNPEHDQAWYDKVTQGMDRSMIARMFELSFEAYTGSPVFLEFDDVTHIPEMPMDIIPGQPMMIGWDFGYHYPAAVFGQINSRDQFQILREYEDFDISFHKFAGNVKRFAHSLYNPRDCPEIHFVDPAGFQRYSNMAESGAASDVAQIKKTFGRQAQIRRGAKDVGTRDNEGPRLKEVREALSLRGDKLPGFLIDKICKGLIEGFHGAYCYPDKGGEQPDKNEASHKHDANQYLITGHNRMVRPHITKKDKPKRKRIGHRLGF